MAYVLLGCFFLFVKEAWRALHTRKRCHMLYIKTGLYVTGDSALQLERQIG